MLSSPSLSQHTKINELLLQFVDHVKKDKINIKLQVAGNQDSSVIVSYHAHQYRKYLRFGWSYKENAKYMNIMVYYCDMQP